MKTVLVVQARTGSTRLPGKVLLEACGRPLLELMVARLRAVQFADELVIATTWASDDEPIRDLCRKIDVRCESGHPSDLLERHARVAELTGADAVVKVPSDCPLIDPRVVDSVLATARDEWGRFDLFTNLRPPSWPDGNDVEVMSREVLELARREATRPFEREHTTPFIWERPERFRVRNVSSAEFAGGSYRLTLDYWEDYLVIKAVFEALAGAPCQPFSVEDIVRFLEAHPEIAGANQRWAGTCWQWRHLAELYTSAFGERAESP